MSNRTTSLLTALSWSACMSMTAVRAEDGAGPALDRLLDAAGRLAYMKYGYYERTVILLEIRSEIDNLDKTTRTDVGKLFQGVDVAVREALRQGPNAMPQLISYVSNLLRAQVQAAREWLEAQEKPLVLRFQRGDTTGDGARDISDAVRLLGYLFRNEAEPACMKAADINDDGNIDISDPIGLLMHLFRDDFRISAPSVCAPDPTPDDLSCEDHNC